MAETAAALPVPRPSPTVRAALTRNPVVLKELRGRMRGPRAFVLLTFHLLVMSGFVALVYLAFDASGPTPYANAMRDLGKYIFSGIVIMELVLACIITPSITSSAISSERERQTYELLRTTLLSARALVLGKLIAALLFILLLLLAAIPLQSLAFLFGGVAPEEVAIASLMLVATAFLFGTAGLFFSALTRRTVAATVMAYGFALVDLLGLPLLMIVVGPFIGSWWFGYGSSPGPVTEAVVIYLIGALVAANPLATAVAAEAILIEQHTVFFYSQSLSNGASIPLVSPWLPYVLFCFALGALMLVASVWRVKQVER